MRSREFRCAARTRRYQQIPFVRVVHGELIGVGQLQEIGLVCPEPAGWSG
jgi:hypothetical protein